MTKFNKKAFIKAATKVEEIMSTPSEVDIILNNLKWGDYQQEDGTWSRGIANREEIKQALKQSLVAEMPKKIDIEIQPNPSDDEYVEWGIRNNVLTQVDQAINKAFNGRM